MAGASKKSRKVAKPASDEEYQSDESGGYHGQQEIQATFEGRNPDGQDFHGIKQLLNQLFLTAHVDLGQMSDMLISQAGIGSVLKQSFNDSDDEEDMEMVEESDVFGITSVINLTQHKETPCVQQLYKLVDDEVMKQADPEAKSLFKEIVGNNSNKIGFIINERFVNIPSKISLPMLHALQDEIHRMGKKNDGYKFDYYLMICKNWKSKSDGSEIVFSNDEEEIFWKKADCRFEYSVAGKSDTGLTGNWQSEDKELIPHRVIILFKADKLPSIISEIQNFVSN
ncbi:Protein BCCIP homolog-like Protein [Tribolium castaneum]|uniref:Protein BCCIP homolog n=1 Tax=Tribolium castaneum TaxID=7070 RepID=D6X111_TRICA|nr:PREDICTED: protein BCCIP homolog [Tribolium castaneum]EFA09984.1 Protein BCCIP homolog-like Protein [Tribolium castaneum]|eukprot:XP_974264.1 PREDICTED: protein BCCIP homolog [Tribolium castaneum]